MKCLVECTIQNIGGNWRIARFEAHGMAKREAHVDASACRLPDGSPIPEYWPPFYGQDGRIAFEPALVEAEIIVPSAIFLNFGGIDQAYANPESIRLPNGNKPGYTLTIQGTLKPVMKEVKA